MSQTRYKLRTEHIHFKTSIPHVGSKQNEYQLPLFGNSVLFLMPTEMGELSYMIESDIAYL